MSALTAPEWAALWLSLKVAFWCTVVTAVPGVALGWLLARCRFWGKALVDAAVHLPLVLPPVVVGWLLLILLGRRGPVGALLAERLGVDVAFTWVAAVLASAVMGFPLMVRAVRLAVELVDPALEDAARSLGAPPWRVLATITLPLAAPGIVTGMILAFARSLGEFGATITFAGNIAGETRTLPLAIFTAIQTPGDEATVGRLVVLSVGVAIVAMLAAELLARKARRRMEGR